MIPQPITNKSDHINGSGLQKHGKIGIPPAFADAVSSVFLEDPF
jgi:hypothetical protein